MSIFNTIGRLTYKTQRVLTRSVADPVKDITQGYTQAKVDQAQKDQKTKEILHKYSADNNVEPVQMELDI